MSQSDKPNQPTLRDDLSNNTVLDRIYKNLSNYDHDIQFYSVEHRANFPEHGQILVVLPLSRDLRPVQSMGRDRSLISAENHLTDVRTSRETQEAGKSDLCEMTQNPEPMVVPGQYYVHLQD